MNYRFLAVHYITAFRFHYSLSMLKIYNAHMPQIFSEYWNAAYISS